MVEIAQNKMDELDSLSELGRSRLESVSKVAIRNIKPAQIDPNDPDQRKLIEKLNQMEVKIWGYSDNQPSFLAKLNKNNPPDTRKALESIVYGQSLLGSLSGEKALTLNKKASTFSKADDPPDPDTYLKAKIHNNQRRVLFNRSPAARLSMRSADDKVPAVCPSMTDTIATAPKEMKMIIKKTIELVADMSKSVELAFHAIRATARFLTYPTPSIPSDNHACGHVKGWIWLIYKGLLNFNSNCDDLLLHELLQRLRTEMSKLANQATDCAEAFSNFHKDLKSLHDSVKKEAKFLKSQSTLWSLRVDSYIKYAEELKLRRNLLLDIREDRPFTSDWVFEPHPSKAGLHRNFFHFQWVRNKKDWEVDQFEIRSDYSTRWHPYCDFAPELQMELVFHLIEHLAAILDESTNFIKINMHLTFDFDEIKCLRFAVAEIHSVKKNQRTAEYVGDMTKKLFEDMALLEEISQEFMDQLDWIVNIMNPCYESIKKQIKNEPYLPLEFPGSRGPPNVWCGCFSKSKRDFLQLNGEPMQAVFLRTPISEDTVERFFPKEHLIDNEVVHLPSSARINVYGVSDGYNSSLFDHAIGRDPPVKIPKRLPKFRRKSQHRDKIFNLSLLIELSNKVIRLEDNELDTEIYLQIFEQIKNFLQTFGSMFNFIVSELTERLENLDNRLYTELSDYYESLEKMIDHEVSSGLIVSDPLTCGTRAFKRIHIVFLFFTLFVDNLTHLDDYEGTSYACKTAYYKSYAKYHSWFVQKTSMFSIYSIPNKKIMYNKVCPELEITEVDTSLAEFVKCAVKIYEHCESVFKNKEINDL